MGKKLPEIRTINMTPADWENVPDNPIQRDTIKHATKSSRPGSHLSITHTVHGQLAMAETESGKRWKLDGHSRSWLWSQDLLTPPPKLIVTVIKVDNKAAAIEEYRKYDNSSAVENARDRLFGAFKVHGINPHHGYLFDNAGMLSAFKYAAEVTTENATAIRTMPTDVLVKPWVDTLKVFDSGDFTNHFTFRAPVTLAALLTIRKHGNTALSFWQAYHDDSGIKSAKTCDGVFYATGLFTLMKHEAENRGGRRIMTAFTPHFLYAFDCWLASKRIKPVASVLGRRVPEDIHSVAEWWEINLGKPDHVHLKPVPEQPELDLV